MAKPLTAEERFPHAIFRGTGRYVRLSEAMEQILAAERAADKAARLDELNQAQIHSTRAGMWDFIESRRRELEHPEDFDYERDPVNQPENIR